MKRIIATTALSLMLSTSAFAMSNTTDLMPYTQEQAGDIYASEFIGMRVYAAENDFDSFSDDTRVLQDAEKEWDDIGEINDVILGRNGDVKAVIIGVGGFIGLGEKDVAISMDGIKFVSEEGESDDFFLVVKANKQTLTDIEAYTRVTAEQEMAAKADNAPMNTMTAPMVEREGYMTAKTEELTTEDLTGARVYSSNDEDIGEIDKLLVGDSGKLKQAIVDVGGFLGMGEHRIAVSMDELQILRNEGGDDVRIYIGATKEELEAQPQYKG